MTDPASKDQILHFSTYMELLEKCNYRYRKQMNSCLGLGVGVGIVCKWEHGNFEAIEEFLN